MNPDEPPSSPTAASIASDASDEEVCKICRTGHDPSDDDAGQLFSPCRCKGSIGSVHEPCLMAWLAAANSRDKCEVCHTTYQFSKVYARDVPQRLPVAILIKRMLISFVWINAMALRVALVAFCWIGFLPYCTVWFWRFYFWSGRNSSEAFANILSPAKSTFITLHESVHGISTNVSSNATLVATNATVGNMTEVANTTLVVRDWSEIMLTLGKDCFTGQIITCAVVILFIAVFMLREWMQQQGVEDAAARQRQAARAIRQAVDHVAAVEQPIIPLLPDRQGAQGASARRSLDTQPTLTPQRDPQTAMEAVDEIKSFAEVQKFSAEMDAIREGLFTRPSMERRQEFGARYRNLKATAELLTTEALDSHRKIISEMVAIYQEMGELVDIIVNADDVYYEAYLQTVALPARKIAKLPRRVSVRSTSMQRDTSSSSGDRPLPSTSMSPSIPDPDINGEEHVNPLKAATADDARAAVAAYQAWLADERIRKLKHSRSLSSDAGVSVDPTDMQAKAGPSRPHEVSAGHSPTMLPSTSAELQLSLRQRFDGVGAADDLIHSASDGATDKSGATMPEPDPLLPSDAASFAQAVQAPIELPANANNPLVDLEAWVNDDAADDDDDDLVAEDEANGDQAGVDMDDLDGVQAVLEAMGLTGSLFALFQLVCLMTFLMIMVLSISLWLPFIIGRTFLISHGAYNIMLGFYNLVAGPVRLTRALTDPILDYGSHALNFSSSPAVSILWSHTDFSNTFSNTSLVQTYLGRHISNTNTSWIDALSHVGVKDSSFDRTLSVLSGYMVILSLLTLWYIRERWPLQPRNPTWTLILEEHGRVLKVGLFLIIELIVFPSLCGLELNLIILPLFEGSSLTTRIAYYGRAPCSGLFITWTVGTIYMFVVASWISLCRGSLRKGALYFIRDPKDPNSHPIKEMIDAVVPQQLMKLFKSVFIYSTLLAALALAGLAIHCLTPGLLPLRLHYRKPLAEVPIDLIAFTLLVPPSLVKLRPIKVTRKLVRKWTVIVAHQLRLSSFLLRTRVPAEEGTFEGRFSHKLSVIVHFCSHLFSPRRTLAKERAKDHQAAVQWRPSGHLLRVPAVDNLKLDTRYPSSIAVNGDGSPIDARALAARNAHQEAGSVESDWTLVYVPPRFHFRLCLALYLLWTGACFLAILSCTVPILAGRFILAQMTTSYVHDGYAFLLGAYVTAPTLMTMFWLRRKWRLHRARQLRRAKRKSSALRTPSTSRPTYWSRRITRAREAARLTRKLVVSGSLAFVVLPFLVGLAFELHFMLPWKYAYDQPPVFDMPELWSCGFILLFVAYGLSTCFHRPLPGGRAFLTELDSVFAPILPLSWSAFCTKLTKKILIPSAKKMIGAIVLPLIPPLLVFGAAQHWQLYDFAPAYRLVATKLCYHALFVGANVGRLHTLSRALSKRWIQNVKDSEYLLERRLVNFEEGRRTRSESTGQT